MGIYFPLYLRVGLLGHIVTIFNLLRNCQLFPRVAAISPYDSYSNGCEVEKHMDLICSSVMASDIEHLFMYLNLYIFFREISIQIILPIFKLNFLSFCC